MAQTFASAEERAHMRRSVDPSGALDPHPPLKEAFRSRSWCPPRWMVEEFYGKTVWHGLGASLQRMQLGRGKGAAFRGLSEAFDRGDAGCALVWVSSAFSKSNMMTAPGENDCGFWYPCIVAVDDEGFVWFLCPRLALDGTKCWVAHPTRIILFIMEQDIEIGAGIFDLRKKIEESGEGVVALCVCPRKKRSEKEEDEISIASTTPPSTHTSSSTASSGTSSSSTMSWETVGQESAGWPSAAPSSTSWNVVGQESTGWPSAAPSDVSTGGDDDEEFERVD